MRVKVAALSLSRHRLMLNWMNALLCAAIVALFATVAHAEDKAADAEPTLEQKADLVKVLAGDHVLGAEDSPVLIIEYASLSCPHCAAFHAETFPELKKRYLDTNKATFIFRHFPFNEPALRAAQLTECVATSQGNDKFYTFLKVLFGAQEKWAFSGDYLANLKTLAAVGGVSSESFDACIADKAVENKLVGGVSLASKYLGVASTPTLFINGEKVEGSRTIDDLAKKIDPYLTSNNE